MAYITYHICIVYRPPRPATPPSNPKQAATAEGVAKGPAVAAGEKKRKVNPIRDNISGERVRVYYCLSLSLLYTLIYYALYTCMNI